MSDRRDQTLNITFIHPLRLQKKVRKHCNLVLSSSATCVQNVRYTAIFRLFSNSAFPGDPITNFYYYILYMKISGQYQSALVLVLQLDTKSTRLTKMKFYCSTLVVALVLPALILEGGSGRVCRLSATYRRNR